MKHAIALSALFAGASQALSFTNTEYKLAAGQSFNLEFEPVSECAGGCTIELCTGPDGSVKCGRKLTTTTPGSNIVPVVPSADWPAGRLSFKIATGATPPVENYSGGFTIREGDASASDVSSSPASSATGASATGVSATNSGMSTSSSAAATSSSGRSAATNVVAPTGVGRVTNSSSSASPNPPARNGTSVSSSRSPNPSSTGSPSDNVPSSGVGRVTASLALAAGVVAAMAYLN